MENSLHIIVASVPWFIASFVLFSAAALLWPAHKGQKLIRSDIGADLVYWFLMPIFYNFARILLLSLALLLAYGDNQEAISHFIAHGGGPLATLPLWVQVLLMLLISDFLQYWIHRWFHENRMWKFHAIHHSPKEIDWLTAVRFHPVNILLYITPMAVITTLLGFSPVAFAWLVPFNVLYSGFVHANLNWTLGPLKYVLASPVFHRWHHTAEAEGRDKNFAPTFPFLDMMFGTYYMPAGRLPTRYGIGGKPMPDDFMGQLRYPFKKD